MCSSTSSFADEFRQTAGPWDHQDPPHAQYSDSSVSLPLSKDAFSASGETQKNRVVRKPAPPSPAIGLGIWDRSVSVTATAITAGDGGYKGDRAASRGRGVGGGGLGSANTSATPSYNKGGGMLGNLVKDRVTGRRKMSQLNQAPPPVLQADDDDADDVETPVIRLSPAGLHSIDDWLDSKEGLHKRSNTVSTVSTQYPHSDSSSLKLHLRQSTFRPLQPPAEFIQQEENSTMPVPPIPARFYTKPVARPSARTSSLVRPNAPQRQQRALPPTPYSQPISPPITPERKPRIEEPPRDHIGQLEYEQEQNETRKRELHKEIWAIEQRMKVATMERSRRDRLKARLDDLNQDYADAEKLHHDLGLKLYRAYRRRDKREGVEGPTHLWVSRVTAPREGA